MDPGTMTNDELADRLAEMYPGEVPTNDEILDWITEIRDKAAEIDNLIP